MGERDASERAPRGRERGEGEDPPAPWRRGLTHAVLLWGGEASLARISGGPLDPGDLALSAAAIGIPIAGAVALGARGRAARRVAGVLARLPLCAVALGIASPAGEQLLVALLLAGGAALWLARGSVLARLGRDPWPTPLATLAGLGGASGLAWSLGTGLPPGTLLLGVAGAWCALWVLTRRPLGAAVAFALCAVAALAPDPPLEVTWTDRGDVSAPEAPDLVLVTVDTLRADAAERMQSFRKLAESGVAFSAVQASAPWTLPSMASLFTGLPVAGHGARRLATGHFSGMPDDAATLASRLAAAGYDTLAVVAANPFVGPEFGFARGFDAFHHALVADRFGLPRWPGPSLRPTAPGLLALAGLWPRSDRGDALHLVRRALGLFAQRRDRPVFLWLHLLDPHLPYAHAAEAPLEPAWRRAVMRAREPRRMAADPRWSSEAGQAALRAAYDHEVAHVDVALLELLDGLGPRPPRGRIVALTSDHGEEFFEHGGFEHGHSFHDEVLRVPLVIAGVEDAETGRREDPAGLVDLAPTLLRAVGLDAADLPGRDLFAPGGPAAYTSRDLLYPEDARDDESHAVRSGRWKVIVRGGAIRLYDAERDPGERRDLAARQPALAARVAALADRAGRAGERVDLGAAESEALRALGYLTE